MEMFKTKKTEKNLYSISSQGHLIFDGRESRLNAADKSLTIWEYPISSLIILFLCAVLDGVMFYTLFSAFLYDTAILVMLSTIALLIGFDVAPAVAGVLLKKRSQGINASILMIVLLAVAFLVAFAGNTVLRITYKDLVLPDLSSVSTSVFGAIENSTTAAAEGNNSLIYALFASMMPLITSLVSFAVSFQSSNPLKTYVRDLKLKINDIENEIEEIDAALIEYDADLEFFERISAEDEEKYQNMLKVIDEKAVFYCNYVRQRIKERLGDPVSTNILSMDNRKALLRLVDDDDDNPDATQELNTEESDPIMEVV